MKQIEARVNGLSTEDLGTLENALADAIDYREPDNGHCGDCTDGELCEDHAGDREAADAYGRLRSRLSDLPGRPRQPELEAG